MASYSFNLVDEKWIPCIMPDGTPDELGLLETLVRANEIQEVFDPSPLVTASLHRLLLAILHRNFGPRSIEEWKVIWEAGHFDKEALEDYFHKWHHRFDLFDDRYPFYQVAEFGKKRAKTVAVNDLLPEQARGNNPTLFDHTLDDDCAPLDAAVAARGLLALQAFKLGGLSGLGPNFVDAPSARNVLFFMRGENLFKTLTMNFVKYNEEEPIPGSDEDRLAWERDQLLDSPIPKGYLDYLTWQTLSLRLRPYIKDINGVKIRGLDMALGRNLENKGEFFDPAVAYQKKGGWNGLRFSKDKALWRDSTTLFNFALQDERPPETLRWIALLVQKGIVERNTIYTVDAYGLYTTKAKIEFWRRERMPLHLDYLTDEYLVDDLKSALNRGKDVGKALISALKRFAAISVLPSTGSKVDWGSVNDVVEHLGADRLFWSRLETPFHRLLPNLPRDRDEALKAWTATLRRTAWDAFNEATRDLDRSARTLKALGEARQKLDVGLWWALDKFDS